MTDGERGGGWEKIDLKTTKTKYDFVIIQVLWTLLEIMMTVCPCCNKNRTNKHFFTPSRPNRYSNEIQNRENKQTTTTALTDTKAHAHAHTHTNTHT